MYCIVQMGGKDILQRKFADLTDYITIVVSRSHYILSLTPGCVYYYLQL